MSASRQRLGYGVAVLIDLCDGLLFADQYGAAPPRVVALHGWARSRRDWAPVLDGLDAVAVDLPGFGRSPVPPGPWGTAEYADRLADCLDGDGLVLAGHSFGGRVAVQFAANYPDRVRALVLTGVPLLHRSGRRAAPPLTYRLVRRADRAGLVPARQMEWARNRYGSVDYRAAEGVMRSVLVTSVNEQYAEQLEAIRTRAIPTYLVWGQEDDAVPLETARRAAELLGDTAEVDVVAGSSHLLDTRLAAAVRSRIDQAAAASPGQVA